MSRFFLLLVGIYDMIAVLCTPLSVDSLLLVLVFFFMLC